MAFIRLKNIFLLSFLSLFILAQVFTQPAGVPEPEITAYAETGRGSGSTFTIFVLYEFPENFYQTHNPDFFNVSVTNPEIPGGYRVVFPEGKTEGDVINYHESALLRIEIENMKQLSGAESVSIEAGYQLCDENGTCYMPGRKELSVSLAGMGEPGPGKAETGFDNLLKYLLFALAGGLLLNIMPCVFPLLSIKALALVRQSGDDRRSIMLSALSYAAGITASLLVLALFIIALREAGSYAGWGFQMQNPYFVTALSAVIFLFSLSMFDVFTVTLPGGNTAGKASAVKGYAGHFLTGIFAVLVAAPCTAPFLGPAIAFALTQNTLTILGFFVFIGIGFSLPFTVLGFFPALIKKLPKPGRWSIIFRELLGFVLAATALYLVAPLVRAKPQYSSGIIYFFFTLAFAAWLYGKGAQPGSGAKRVFTSLLLASALTAGGWALFINFSSPAEAVPEKTADSRESIPGINETYEKVFSTALLEEELSKNNPVFVNIYAEWCTTCKINDRIVFSSEEFRNTAEEKGITVLKGDFTYGDRDIASWMNRHGKAGVPVYAYYPPAGDKSSPYFFPEILSKDLVIKKFSENH